jgi:hypothetical protein
MTVERIIHHHQAKVLPTRLVLPRPYLGGLWMSLTLNFYTSDKRTIPVTG